MKILKCFLQIWKRLKESLLKCEQYTSIKLFAYIKQIQVCCDFTTNVDFFLHFIFMYSRFSVIRKTDIHKCCLEYVSTAFKLLLLANIVFSGLVWYVNSQLQHSWLDCGQTRVNMYVISYDVPMSSGLVSHPQEAFGPSDASPLSSCSSWAAPSSYHTVLQSPPPLDCGLL